ncbi:MAG: mechanosensitive ion channel family protein [Phycisphaerae bacterium]|nr:mechanosensitive ion channel family protein [Phycisphaerae bacterium]
MAIIHSTVLAGYIDWFYDETFLNNEPWRWLSLLGVLLGGFVVGKVVAFSLERQSQRLREGDRMTVVGMLLRSLARPVTLLLLAAALYLAQAFMVLDDPESLARMWANVCRTLTVLAAGWFIYHLVDIVEILLYSWTSKTETLLDDQLVPLVRKTLRVFVVIIAVLFIARNIFQWDIASLIAGLGIGGLALALAAKDTLANFFGSITIFADRPFHMGDRVRIKGHDGVIEEVGFRSVRLRLLNGHLVIIPNATVANEAIENVSRRPYIKHSFTIGVTYDTPPDKLRRGVEIIRQMLAERKDSFPPDNPGRAHFTEFAAASLNIDATYWFTPVDWAAFLDFKHEFNTDLLRRFNDEGIEFAFPTQTLYLKQDSPSNVREEQ